MEYSAVTHPVPFPFKKGGTFSSIEAVQMTLVSPISIRTDPSACLMKFLVTLTGRSCSLRRPSARTKLAAGFMKSPLRNWGIIVKRFPNRNETALRSAPEDRERSVCLTVQNLTGSHEIVQRLGWWAAGFRTDAITSSDGELTRFRGCGSGESIRNDCRLSRCKITN